ncbi:MAG: pyridoxine 5'-phosphate synthase [Ignavibacteriales bacterium]|nr:pyridoxine 5'-phosphate synthase [Ignavibacteriales bacterium]
MRLAINIDHIATLRNARGGSDPDPVKAALLCEEAGAVGIVCHLREDRRHMKDDDVRRLRDTIRKKLDLEMAATEEIIGIAIKTKPDLVTLVPERRLELTTEGGLDVVAQKKYLGEVVKQFRRNNIPVSLFIDPTDVQVRASADIGTDMIEIHTGEYAEAKTESEVQEQFQRIQEAAKLGQSLNLGVNAGHGLDYENTAAIAAIHEIDEMSIGHAVIVRALFVGLEQAVREMLHVVEGRTSKIRRQIEEE